MWKEKKNDGGQIQESVKPGGGGLKKFIDN